MAYLPIVRKIARKKATRRESRETFCGKSRGIRGKFKKVIDKRRKRVYNSMRYEIEYHRGSENEARCRAVFRPLYL